MEVLALNMYRSKLSNIHCSYNIILLDINECDEDSHNCEHNCTNTAGSFACSCNSGYRLDDNGRNCSGRYPAITGLCDVLMVVVANVTVECICNSYELIRLLWKYLLSLQ